MGSGASKTAHSTARKFPSRAPGAAVPPSSRPVAPRAPPPASRSVPKASATKDEAITTDGGDPDHMTSPDFSQRLRQMGVATPNPTLSNSSTASHAVRPQPVPATQQRPSYPIAAQNQTLTVLEARQRLEEQVELQQENPAGGRNFADVGTLRQALVMKGLGIPNTDIEKRLRLRNGIVARIESGGAISPLN
ncbi:hypothetical protein BJ166DRAFT_623066 [Pestalotiopsis sp. NC0098]|nr:hypothetical protein BJ166DRAFT_623066 [Pestalotiopsis sp. NC0098]